MALIKLLYQPSYDINQLANIFNGILKEAVEKVNKEFSPRRLSKLPREIEPLPSEKRQFSSYRTRIGTMLEYAIGTAIDQLLEAKYGMGLSLTFAPAHEYPDFFLRNDTLAMLMKIEMKAVDADSDEQAARFSTPTHLIDPAKDLLLLVGWEWTDLTRANQVVGEFPYIFASVILPAGEIAKERDERLLITGGKVDGEEVYVYSKKKGEYVSDPGNYGKFWRIIHSKRRSSSELSETLQEFEKFLKQIDDHAPRKRLRSPKRLD